VHIEGVDDDIYTELSDLLAQSDVAKR